MAHKTIPFTKPRIEDRQRRVRVLFNGEFIVDTTKAKLVWEKPSYPTYYFEKQDIATSFLQESGTVPDAKIYDLVVGDKVEKGAVTEFTNNEYLAGLLRITFSAVDAWFEEDEMIHVHPKDPYKRIDVLQSSRHVRVEVNGVEVANTHRPRFLFETGPPRQLGVASYYDVVLPDGSVHKDVVWFYRAPLAECIQVGGLVAFYDEKVDVWVDGEKQE
ncbi:hypothetical protein ID866_6098 [Astraeus odoratus]|nr:hypothetical protein ID866_6098 [Astraeus odoratus]